MMKNINAAGGLVRNNLDEILLIHRLGKWDLPKGKQEPGESIENTAVREVAEECGLLVNEIEQEDLICKTTHFYEIDSQAVEKTTYWYVMRYNADAKLVPQTEEGIEEVRWVSVEDVKELLVDSYDTIREVFAKWQGGSGVV